MCWVCINAYNYRKTRTTLMRGYLPTPDAKEPAKLELVLGPLRYLKSTDMKRESHESKFWCNSPSKSVVGEEWYSYFDFTWLSMLNVDLSLRCYCSKALAESSAKAFHACFSGPKKTIPDPY
ncbi:hypothetical protein CEXT_796941 [Caerostris extrusa]|uniref:Uncharacterized protein n=1 Tax=Caerostris extrusa TaxID=172846 RepID=A0AAV4X9E6_CAEEX|nr:hypothetical protein CEXT_796941 [Caerostris extrusa]